MIVTFILSRDDQRLASRMIYRLQPRTSLMRVINFWGSLLGSLLMTAGGLPLVRILYERGGEVAEITFCLGAVIAGGFIWFCRRFLVTRIGQNRSGIFNIKYSYEVGTDRIITIKNDNIKTEIFPTAIHKIVNTPQFTFIFVGEAYAYFIPTSAFSSDSERSEFINKLDMVKKAPAEPPPITNS